MQPDFTSPKSSSTSARPDSELDRLAESWLAQQIELEPELRVSLGVAGDKTQYADYSPSGIAAQRAAAAAMLAQVEQCPAVDDVDEVTKLELQRTLALQIEGIDAGLPLREVNNIATPAHSARSIFDLMPQASAADFEQIAARMRNVPAALDGYRQTLTEGVNRGVVAARRQVEQLATQTAAYAKADGFFTELAETDVELPDSLRTELRAAAAQAAQSYAALSDFLRDQVLPAADPNDAVGRELYQLQSRRFLGSTVDLDETYQWGLEELARMRDLQDQTAAELGHDNAKQAAAALDADPQFLLPNAQAFRTWMQQRADEAVAALDGSHFEFTEQMRVIECCIAPTQEGGVYYTEPSDDFSRPGRMWWSVPEGKTIFATWQELTTVYHEGVPGHHMQFATAVANKELNAWRRANWCSGHGEGWALYAEKLMLELGFLDHPAYRLGMLDGQRMRAARVILDIGVHLGKPAPAQFAPAGFEADGKPWNFEFARAFFASQVSDSPQTVDFEVNRYFGWPGQAPAYKIGQRIWEQLRETAESKPDFNLKAWHTKALRLGGIGLDSLQKAMA